MKERMKAAVDESVTRRRILATTGGLLAGGVTLQTVGMTGVQAEVTTGGLSVSDGSIAATDGTVYSPVLEVSVDYAYEGVGSATQCMVALMVDGTLLISTILEGVTAPADSGSHTLSAPIVESRAYTSEDWNAPDGSEVSHDVAVEARLEVRDSSGKTKANAKSSDTVTITVSDGGAAVDSAVGGGGSVSFMTDTPE